ncbi:MAG: hypothetical protein KGI00_00075 [Candidatus Micrarchaeota archaeon]|nr:hypothetical protein [Candidatus Micrarchaeota archaeon]MDE1849113.1 hypothetical protein [Candidatus Micrarchaeota archaeon]
MIPDIDKIEKRLLELESARDKAMQLSRELIRTAGRAITLLHARDIKGANALFKKLEENRSQLRKVEKGFEYHTLQAHQEYTEAMALRSIITSRRIPDAASLGEEAAPYLLGIMDVVGELKREAFEAMRNNRLGDAKLYYSFMLDIYDSTLHMRFASSMLPDFRRKQDSARIQIEGTINEIIYLEARGKK